MCIEQLKNDPRIKGTSSRFVATISAPSESGEVLVDLALRSPEYYEALREALGESNFTNCGCLLRKITEKPTGLTVHTFVTHLSKLEVVIMWRADEDRPYFLDGRWAYDAQVYYFNQHGPLVGQPLPIFFYMDAALKYLESAKPHQACQVDVEAFQNRWPNEGLLPVKSNIDGCAGCQSFDNDYGAFVNDKLYCWPCTLIGSWWRGDPHWEGLQQTRRGESDEEDTNSY